MKCCGKENCVSASCHPYGSCIEGGCYQNRIELIDGCYPIKIPQFVFESDLPFAIKQGARVFHDIWQKNNQDKQEGN